VPGSKEETRPGKPGERDRGGTEEGMEGLIEVRRQGGIRTHAHPHEYGRTYILIYESIYTYVYTSKIYHFEAASELLHKQAFARSLTSHWTKKNQEKKKSIQS